MAGILVTGATGTVGREVLHRLAASGIRVRGLARDPDASHLPDHVEMVRGDLTIPETLDRCMDGIDSVFLVWTAPPAGVASALQRIAEHARRIVFLSAPLKTPHPFFQQPNPHRELAEQIERLIEASQLEWTFLRPGMIAANALGWWAPQIRDGNVVRWPYLSAPTAPIDERDIATVAVRTLCEEGHEGMEYVLTGPESLTQFEQLTLISRVLNRPLHIEEMSPDEARREWFPTWPASVVNMLLDAWAAGIGQPAFITSTFAEVTGTPPRTFLEWATDHADEFRAFSSQPPA